jgi:hypothetical protein
MATVAVLEEHRIGLSCCVIVYKVPDRLTMIGCRIPVYSF